MSDGIIKIIASGSREFFTKYESTTFSNGTNLGTIENMSIETIGPMDSKDHKNIMLIPLQKEPSSSEASPEVVWNVNKIHSLEEIGAKDNPIEDVYGTEITERVTKMFKDNQLPGILLIPLEKGKPVKEHEHGTIIVPR
jgi:hypothetical protein